MDGSPKINLFIKNEEVISIKLKSNSKYILSKKIYIYIEGDQTILTFRLIITFIFTLKRGITYIPKNISLAPNIHKKKNTLFIQ